MDVNPDRASQPATPWEMSPVSGIAEVYKLREQADARLTDRVWLRGAGPAPTSRCHAPSTALSDSHSGLGRVAEWFKAPVLKTGVPARVPWVRIPPLPPPPCPTVS
jgi:hypothetical protein